MTDIETLKILNDKEFENYRKEQRKIKRGNEKKAKELKERIEKLSRFAVKYLLKSYDY